ncbi:MAG: adenine nucleotide alpha hydrolase [Planctomycetaceae bacterium]|nr:adenine nucleotide alpha hydrolase [Planctomycetaceae bacterium]
MPTRVLLSWSSGKDSAWALHVLRQDPEIVVAGLFTVVNAKYQRVAMHAIRLRLLQLQAAAAGLPLRTIEIPDPCSDREYRTAMQRFVERSIADGIEGMAFGDLFLQDIRQYREKQLAGTGITPLFPLWNKPTDQLAREMLAAGVRAIITCVDPRKLPRSYAGREWTLQLLEQLPATVDPCAENGEFHTAVVDGPMFRWPIPVEVGETVERDGFVFADVLPAETA